MFASQSNEDVEVAGRLHVVTQLTGSEETGWTFEWRTNVDNLTAKGQTTGDRYRASGTDGGTVAIPPEPPVREVIFEPSFSLLPPGPPTHPPSPCRLTVSVVYDETGRVSDVQVRAADGTIGSGDT
jgi:hypothetical protein